MNQEPKAPETTSKIILELQDATFDVRCAAGSLDAFTQMMNPHLKPGSILCGDSDTTDVATGLNCLVTSLHTALGKAHELSEQLLGCDLEALQSAQFKHRRQGQVTEAS